MAKPPQKTRGLFQEVFKQFWKSISPKTILPPAGKLVGSDPYGNKYYEVPADPSRGKRRPQRWYTSVETDSKEIIGNNPWGGFDSNLPAEWESWLRHRRDEVPTEEQVFKSLQLAELKKMNAAKLEDARHEELKAQGMYTGAPQPQDHEKAFFPKYDEYEVMPGESEYKEKDKWADFKNPYSKHQTTTKGKPDK